MVQGWKRVWTGTLGAAAVMAASLAAQQQGTTPAAPQNAVAQPGASASQGSAVPDAPTPQALPNLRTIVPVGANIATPPATAQKPETAADGQTAPGSSLPSAPSPTAAQRDEEPPPDLPAAGAGPGSFRLVANVNFVEVPFTVKDSKGQLVPGLTWRDVRVYENGLRQQMRLFTVDPFPLSVALVIDQSVTFDTMEKINNALASLQGAFTPYDEVSVFTYNNGVRQQTAATAAQGARLSAVLERSKGKGRDPIMPLGGPLAEGINKNGQNIDANTSGHPNRPVNSFEAAPKEFHTLNDAILSAAVEVSKSAKGRRRIVYVISDGKEYGSKAKEKDVIKYCQAHNVAVWATLVGDSAVKGLGFLDRIHLPLTMHDDILPRVVFATGGQPDMEFRTAGISRSFQKIAEEARTQYTVGYYSHQPMLDGKYRKLEVRVARPNLTVLAKEGYYPTAAAPTPTDVTPTAVP